MACFVIGSRIDNCNSLLIGISEQNLDRLQLPFHSLHWLPVRRRIEFKTASLWFKAVKLVHSSLLEDYVTAIQSSALSVFFQHNLVNCFSYRHFSWISPFLRRRATNLEWATSLPHELRQCNTLPGFKSRLKYKSSSWRWDTRTWRDVSSYLFTYLPPNYDTPVVP